MSRNNRNSPGFCRSLTLYGTCLKRKEMPAPASGRVLPVAAVGDRGLTAVILRRLSRPRSATAATAMTFPSAKPRLAAASVRRYPAVPSAARGRERHQPWRKEKGKGKRLPSGSGSVSGSGSKRRSGWRLATGNGSDAHETGPAGYAVYETPGEYRTEEIDPDTDTDADPEGKP